MVENGSGDQPTIATRRTLSSKEGLALSNRLNYPLFFLFTLDFFFSSLPWSICLSSHLKLFYLFYWIHMFCIFPFWYNITFGIGIRLFANLFTLSALNSQIITKKHSSEWFDWMNGQTDVGNAIIVRASSFQLTSNMGDPVGLKIVATTPTWKLTAITTIHVIQLWFFRFSLPFWNIRHMHVYIVFILCPFPLANLAPSFSPEDSYANILLKQCPCTVLLFFFCFCF